MPGSVQVITDGKGAPLAIRLDDEGKWVRKVDVPQVWLGICQFNRDLGTEDGERDDGTDWSALMSAVADDRRRARPLVGAAAKSLRMAGGLQDAGAGSGARLSRITGRNSAAVGWMCMARSSTV